MVAPIFFDEPGLGRLANRAVLAYLIVYASNASASLGPPLRWQKGPAFLLHSHLLGTGAYCPKRILTNQDLETLVDTTDAWISERTGTKERRIAAGGGGTSGIARVRGTARAV